MDEKVDIKSLELDEIVKIGCISKEVEILPKVKMKMHTVFGKENTEIIKRISIETEDLSKLNALRVYTLVYAIDEINGKKYTVEQKVEFLQNVQPTLFNLMFNKYNELIEEQIKVIDDLKKK